MLSNFKYDLDYLDSLPIRESSTTYLKHDPTIYCDYKESKLIHFNKSYKKYNNKLQRACIKFINKPVQELATYLLSIKTKNKFHKQALEFVYNCLYNRNTYYNELKYIDIKDGIVILKVQLNLKLKYMLGNSENAYYKPDYKLSNGGRLVYRHDCYFYLVEQKDCYSMDYLGNIYYIKSKYLQLNKRELKYYGISNT